jgi:hypothetical protein
MGLSSADAFNRRDLAVFLSRADDRIETVLRRVGVEGGDYGHDGIRHHLGSGQRSMPQQPGHARVGPQFRPRLPTRHSQPYALMALVVPRFPT